MAYGVVTRSIPQGSNVPNKYRALLAENSGQGNTVWACEHKHDTIGQAEKCGEQKLQRLQSGQDVPF